MTKYLFKKHHLVWDYHNRPFTWYQKSFYWLKIFICLLLDLRTKQDSYLDQIAMIAFDWCKGSYEYGGTDWTEIAVGEGVFRNWYYHIYGNGTH